MTDTFGNTASDRAWGQFAQLAQWKIVCPKHGDVTGFAMTATLQDEGGRSFSRGYCFECVGEALDKLGVPQARGAWTDVPVRCPEPPKPEREPISESRS